MKNLKISEIFREIVKILEIKGGNPFRIRAYERAAENIAGLSEDIENFIRGDKLTQIPGIGKDLAERIKEFVETGRIKVYEDLKKTIPAGLLDLLNIPSVGPKTAKLLYEKLKIKNIAGLEGAIKKNKLKGIFGIKKKTVENISKGIELLKRGRERMTLAQAIQVADEFIKALGALAGVKKISYAGSLRRQKETVRDIDILAISDRPHKIMNIFTKHPDVGEVLARGETKSSVRTKDDIQVDCRVVERKSFGAALLYFTGSKNFNIKIRQIAIRKGLKINEYGVFRKNRFITGQTEEDIFKTLRMSYIEPELREDAGEIELAQKFQLPELIKVQDLKGDLHVHSRWSDGGNTIEEMARAAKLRGYSYIAITDHSQSLKVAGGLSVADLKKKRRQIGQLNKKIKGFRILYGTEADIDSDGRLDYKDETLREFDVVVAAIHSGFKQSKSQLTKRLIRVCRNKYAHIIAHPTGRLWGSRDAYDIDTDEVLKAARDTNTFLEINAFPQRLDLNDLNCRRAKEIGAKLVIGTDAHTTEQLEMMKLGVSVARRGWLSKNEVINTLAVEELLKTIKK
ncbi:MAG: DNA polymerase/3'-5' exonuclease PolX [Candidatus Omnitrophica bacterium]|nr:DNA polymerase/3'-5' exonuclease PolX [Candidatus Omnitrophota bacterium]MBU4473270.1 DNA polymerase/3'-5' exonuclease PolX [Candidatus Omnitrophota bacterium]MCG2706076.1 DNA polymerase/3'-5' exonuclease PolX [Candidatus Omnitrophota bacterium]